ncbi:hypothetical protein Q9966_015991 [Columba livia]|nr:hypothetical protein Q9966_015991 [Columba livia]
MEPHEAPAPRAGDAAGHAPRGRAGHVGGVAPPLPAPPLLTFPDVGHTQRASRRYSPTRRCRRSSVTSYWSTWTRPQGGRSPALPAWLPIPLIGPTGRAAPIGPRAPQRGHHHWDWGRGRSLRIGQIRAPAPPAGRGSRSRQPGPQGPRLDGLGSAQAHGPDCVDQ